MSIEREECLEDTDNNTNDGDHCDDGLKVFVYKYMQFDPYPPLELVYLDRSLP